MVSRFLRWVLEHKSDFPTLFDYVARKKITNTERNITVLKSEAETIDDESLHEELDDAWVKYRNAPRIKIVRRYPQRGRFTK